jgi:hypothetical protein
MGKDFSMRTILLAAFLLAGTVLPGGAQEEMNKAVDQAIKAAQRGDPIPAVAAGFAPYAELQLALLARMGEVNNRLGRFSLINLICSLEYQALSDAHRPYGPSENKELLAALAKLALSETSETVCEAIASCMRVHFTPQALIEYKKASEALLDRTCTIETLTLYVSVIDEKNKQGKEKALASAEKLNEPVQLSLKARWGGKEDADALMAALNKIEKSSGSEIEKWIDAASLASGESAKRLFAEQLRTERSIELIGGGTIPLREVYVSILCRMLRHEKGFPVQKRDGPFSEKELDSIEQWAQQNLKVNYTGSRKPVFSTPGISQ